MQTQHQQHSLKDETKTIPRFQPSLGEHLYFGQGARLGMNVNSLNMDLPDLRGDRSGQNCPSTRQPAPGTGGDKKASCLGLMALRLLFETLPIFSEFGFVSEVVWEEGHGPGAGRLVPHVVPQPMAPCPQILPWPPPPPQGAVTWSQQGHWDGARSRSDTPPHGVWAERQPSAPAAGPYTLGE